eukprot:CAMPEP_0194776618 /NCGR_PEP_ID=MMETSP0323_2-20130528/63574_1 /TAXON_ID=2866 ORGANISM="Crypthecodinium cohnii, Strain Seligo" /NCGR_SAMPLE_ID=MMETSP0323_2 /ASSEMBLY_ACC=CAM_ASM_000346 /LENGTH=74 /DNA_ID=CAMNT_0039713095 /DNA_START=71 /DNA_END=295 /DNA_ORIENTATION=-
MAAGLSVLSLLMRSSPLACPPPRPPMAAAKPAAGAGGGGGGGGYGPQPACEWPVGAAGTPIIPPMKGAAPGALW